MSTTFTFHTLYSKVIQEPIDFYEPVKNSYENNACKNHSSNCVALTDFVLKVLKVLGLYKAIDTFTSSMKF